MIRVRRFFERACVRGRYGGRAAAAAARSRDPAAWPPRASARRDGVGNRNAKVREKAKRTQRSRAPGGAGFMLSGRTSTCAPARADPGYLEDQIAFGATLLFGNVGVETSPSFRALFLKILQDLENKRETRDSRKRARRARRERG